MPQNRQRFLAPALAGALALILTVGSAFAAELMGTIKSVDVDGKKVTVTEKDTDKDVVVTIKDDTEWVSPKGKKIENYDLAKAKKGSVVEVTHEGAVASKVVIKSTPKKKKDAASE